VARITIKALTEKLSLVTLCKLGTTGPTPPPMAGQGWIKVADITPQGSGVVGTKVWQDAAQTVLQSCVSSTLNIAVLVRSSYPLVTVGTIATELPQSADGGHYSGAVNITLSGPAAIVVQNTTPDGDDGASDTVAVVVDAPPQLLTLEFFGGYPGAQTELKAGDTYQISGTTDKPANAVEIIDYGAGTSQVHTFAASTSFSVYITAANRGTTPQLLAARAQARSATTGAYGPTRDTDFGGGAVEGVNLVKLNNLYPTVSFGVITYPVGQGALKDSEQATVAVATANLDTILFDSQGSQLSILNPTTIESPKTVTRIAGTYNVATNNLRASANRAANNSTTVAQTVVRIAHVAATVDVVEPAARLRSGGNNGTSAQDHSISVVSDQYLYEAPTLDAGVGGGTWQGVGFAGGPATWTRALRVHDNDTKGTYNWSNLSAKNLAGIVTTAITGGTSYVLGGFVARTLTFAAFSQPTTMGVAVVDYSKLGAGIFTATNQPALRNAVQGNHDDIDNTYTVDSIGTNPTTLWWNDIEAAASNSGGTAQITNVQEAV
jgi:hypothetical protein